LSWGGEWLTMMGGTQIKITKKNVGDILGLYLVALMDITKAENEKNSKV
jgi:hypothetical protein